MAGQRTREIGVKKVLGASKAGLLLQLMSDLGKTLLLASVIGCVGSGLWIMNWLDSYALKMELLPYHFALPAGNVIGLTLMTVILHMLRAASVNPITVLRNEQRSYPAKPDLPDTTTNTDLTAPIE